MVNYVCSSACAHCLYNCGPTWPKEYIQIDMATEIFRKINSCGCNSIHIGGGEPLLQPEKLTLILETARKNRIGVEYIETNSSWYKNHNQACEILKSLMDAGVTTILTSISPFHNEYIPFKKVKGVIKACRSTGMGVFPWIADFADDIDAFDDEKTHTMNEYQEKYGQDYILNLMHRYSLTMRGRTLKTFKKLLPKYSLEKILKTNSSGCMELINTSHFHFDLYGNYIPGLCTGLSISVKDIGQDLKENEYPILNIIYKEGIKGLFHFALDNFGFQPEKTYISKCELCCEIRKHLVNQCELRSKELQPIEHYKH